VKKTSKVVNAIEDRIGALLEERKELAERGNRRELSRNAGRIVELRRLKNKVKKG